MQWRHHAIFVQPGVVGKSCTDSWNGVFFNGDAEIGYLKSCLVLGNVILELTLSWESLVVLVEQPSTLQTAPSFFLIAQNSVFVGTSYVNIPSCFFAFILWQEQ